MKVFLFFACLFLFAGDANGLRFTQERTQPESETSSSPTDFAEKDLNDIQVFVHERAHPESETSLNQTDSTEEDWSDIQQVLSLLAQASEPYRESFPELDSSRLALLMQDAKEEDDHLTPTLRRRGTRQYRLRRLGFEASMTSPFDKPCYLDFEDVFGDDLMNAFECPTSMPDSQHKACQCANTAFHAANSGSQCSSWANTTMAMQFMERLMGNETWCNENTDKMTWCVINVNDTFCEIKSYCPCMKLDDDPVACQNSPSKCTYLCDGCYGEAELSDLNFGVCASDGLNVRTDSTMCKLSAAALGGSQSLASDVDKYAVIKGMNTLKGAGLVSDKPETSEKKKRNVKKTTKVLSRGSRARYSTRRIVRQEKKVTRRKNAQTVVDPKR